MFFNVRGIKWTLFAILVVIGLSLLDLRCSFSRDRAAREEAATGRLGGIISHVREEVAAGHKELKIQQVDQINEQLRDLRVIARRMVKAGKTKDVRRVMAAIQELEEMKSRLKNKPK